MNAYKLMLSAAALALLFSTPSFATSVETTTDTSFEAPAVPATEAAPTIDTPTPSVETTAPATLEAPAAVDTTTAPASAVMDATTSTTTAPAPTMDAPVAETPTEAAPAAVEAPAEPAPAPKPAKPKVSPPAKLSELSKKYDLMSLDTDGDKSLSRDEFTANGFSNAKTFAAFDFDKNGKLTNFEINAYAKRIEANSDK